MFDRVRGCVIRIVPKAKVVRSRDANASGSSRLGRTRRAEVAAAVVVAYVVATVLARRRGYAIGAHTIVRCRRGHYFTTIWIPGLSLKSLRLGPFRYQRCPVEKHWTLVHPVKGSDLSEAELQSAQLHHDVRIP